MLADTPCVAEAITSGLSSEEETLICIVGPISGRIQAAQAVLTRTDQAHIDGTIVAKSVDGEIVGKDGRPRQELRDDPVLMAKAQKASAPPPNDKPGASRGPEPKSLP